MDRGQLIFLGLYTLFETQAIGWLLGYIGGLFTGVVMATILMKLRK